MTALRHIGVLAGVAVLAGLVAWRVVVTNMADRYASASPEYALKWDARNPVGLLALARLQLAEHSPQAAISSARELLSAEPLQGEAFAVLAEAAQAAGDTRDEREWYEIALRRAPRDLRIRAWIVDSLLQKGRYAEGIEQISLLLQISPAQGAKLFPVLTRLSGTPEFAQALARTLNANPPWRADMLSILLAHGSHQAVDRIYSELQHLGGLSNEETGAWLDQLIQQGQWGEAYSRWASGLELAPGMSLSPVYNGGFEKEPSGIGFDWRMTQTPGVTIDRNASAGAIGEFAVQVSFAGRRVPQINFGQQLLLAPGEYRLRFRARALALRSDKGLQWAIACNGQDEPFVVSESFEGSFGWKAFDTPLVVPPENCDVQRLWLRNPGAAGAGKEVMGDIWFDDFAISNQNASRPASQ